MARNIEINKLVNYIYYLLVPVFFMRFNSVYNAIIQYFSIGWVFFCIVISLLRKFKKNEELKIPNIKQVILLYVMIIYSIVASFFSYDPKQTMITNCIIILSLSYYILIYDTFCLDIKFNHLKKILNIVNIQAIVLIIFQFLLLYFKSINLFGVTITGYYVDTNTGKIMTSIFTNPNSFGMFLCISIYSNLLLILIKKTKIKLNLGLILLYFIVLIFTQSRSSILSVGIVFLLFAFNFKKELLKQLNAKAVFIIFLLSGLFIGMVLVKDISIHSFELDQIGFIKKFQYGMRGRDSKWEIALDIIKQNPLFGIGNISNLDRTYHSLLYAYDTHNGYLNLAIRGGIPLLILYILFILSVYIPSIFKMKKMELEYGNILKGILIILGGILLQQNFEVGVIFSSITHFAAAFFWLLIAYIFIIINKNKNVRINLEQDKILKG